MNYELALKLKNAGFPQNTDGGGEILYKEGQSVTPRTDWGASCYAPTLSELIEACGNDFNLSNNVYGSDRKWTAISTKIKPFLHRAYGDTPEEAVANLWLSML